MKFLRLSLLALLCLSTVAPDALANLSDEQLRALAPSKREESPSAYTVPDAAYPVLAITNGVIAVACSVHQLTNFGGYDLGRICTMSHSAQVIGAVALFHLWQKQKPTPDKDADAQPVSEVQK